MNLREVERAADAIRARQAARRARLYAIGFAPEAEGRELLALALAARGDLSVDRAREVLATAPDLSGVEEIVAFVTALPAWPQLTVVQ